MGASSVTVSVSLRGPEKMGEKITLTVQLAFAGTVAALQEATEFVKSAALFPAAEILEMCIGTVPVLVMATVMGVLARPCVVAGNVTEVGRKFKSRPAGWRIYPRADKSYGLRAAGGIVREGECGLTNSRGRRRERFVHNARSVG